MIRYVLNEDTWTYFTYSRLCDQGFLQSLSFCHVNACFWYFRPRFQCVSTITCIQKNMEENGKPFVILWRFAPREQLSILTIFTYRYFSHWASDGCHMFITNEKRLIFRKTSARTQLIWGSLRIRLNSRCLFHTMYILTVHQVDTSFDFF